MELSNSSSWTPKNKPRLWTPIFHNQDCSHSFQRSPDSSLSLSDRLVSIYSWVQSTRISIYFGFDLHKIPISNCPLFDLHEFWSAQFSICTVFALQFLDLQRFRSAQYSICTDFDLHGFRSTCISICKSILDLWIFRSANQISIYRFFDLQIKFRSTDFSICKSNFDLKIFRSVLCTMIKYLQYSPKWTWNSQYHDILKFLDTIIPIICIDWHSRNLK